MPGLRPDVDPDGLQEFSVVFTDRSLKHMSAKFQTVMRDISSMLREVYQASAGALVPDGGTYALEPVARQFSSGRHALIVRNGWLSFRWTQILEMGGFAAKTTVVMARQTGNGILSLPQIKSERIGDGVRQGVEAVGCDRRSVWLG